MTWCRLEQLGAQGKFVNRKRTGVYGSYLLACYDEENDCFETVTMMGSGLKDEELQEFYERMKEFVVSMPEQNYVTKENKMDVWFLPKVVWECKTADLSMSPKYCGAMNLTADGRGISLRFPRFIKERPDKKPEEATSSMQVLDMFNNQSAFQ